MQFIKTKVTATAVPFILGTTIEIQTILSDNLESADTITIQIQDESNTKKIENVSMDEVTPGVYNYLWQTSEGGIIDSSGSYIAFISVTFNNRVYIDAVKFNLLDLLEE